MIRLHRIVIGLIFLATATITGAAKLQAPIWIFAVCIGALVASIACLAVLDVRLAAALEDRDGFLALLAQDAKAPVDPLVPPGAPRCTLCLHCRMGRNLFVCTLPRSGGVSALPCAMARGEDGDCGPTGDLYVPIPVLPAPPRVATV